MAVGQDHPGGVPSIMAYAGKDATKEFNMMHKPDILTKYAQDLIVGTVKATVPAAPAVASVTPAAAPAAAAEPVPAGQKEYTVDEVRPHNNKDDCWIIIHDKVYDVTAFLQARAVVFLLFFSRPA